MPLEDEADGRVSLMHAFAREHEICRIFFPPLPRPDLPGLAVTELSRISEKSSHGIVFSHWLGHHYLTAPSVQLRFAKRPVIEEPSPRRP
jgi:hypothetical protein